MPKFEWWVVVVPLGLLSVILQGILFPSSSALWQLPIGAIIGRIVEQWLDA